MSTKFQNKANLQEAGSRQLDAFPPNKANSTFLNPGILASVYSYFLPNEPNSVSQFSILNSQFRSPRLRNEPNYPVYPVNPVKNNNSSYPSLPSVAKNMILQNKANFPIFDLKTRVPAKNKPNFKLAQASVLESKSASAPGGFLTFSLYFLPFYFSPNEPNFKTTYLCNL